MPPKLGWNHQKNFKLKKMDEIAKNANAIYSIEFLDECWNLEHDYNILYWHFLKMKINLVGTLKLGWKERSNRVVSHARNSPFT